MLKLQSKVNDIPVLELKDGQIGIVTEWTGDHYIGFVVQRYRNELVSIGLKSGNSWCEVPNNTGCRVRILDEGEILVIINNQ